MVGGGMWKEGGADWEGAGGSYHCHSTYDAVCLLRRPFALVFSPFSAILPVSRWCCPSWRCIYGAMGKEYCAL